MQQAIRPNRRWAELEEMELEQLRFQTQQAQQKLDWTMPAIYAGMFVWCLLAWYGLYKLILG